MPATVLHRLLILHPDDDRVLLERSASGWDLPQLSLPELHTAVVEHINAAVRERWKIDTTVLCALDHRATATGSRRTHALEARAPLPSLGDDLKWGTSPFSIRTLDLPWAQRGWWPQVRSWIAARVGEAEVVQVRAWESSCVARVHARGEREPTHWFKALPPSMARETRATTWLAGRPGAPQIVASDSERQWLLLRHFAGASLDDMRDPAAWSLAAATWGRLQATTLGLAKELGALGCVERRLDTLATSADALLCDPAALMPGHPEGMSEAQITAFRRFAPKIARRAEELAALELGAALDHGDLWPSNILVGGGQCIIIDWEDAGIAHPFLSLGPFAVMVREWQVPLPLTELASQYLGELYGPSRAPELQSALLRSLALGFLEMAVRYWRMPPEMVELNPWMRETVPFFLRHLLALENELAR